MKKIIFKEIDIKTAALRQTNVASEVCLSRGVAKRKLSKQPKQMLKFFKK